MPSGLSGAAPLLLLADGEIDRDRVRVVLAEEVETKVGEGEVRGGAGEAGPGEEPLHDRPGIMHGDLVTQSM